MERDGIGWTRLLWAIGASGCLALAVTSCSQAADVPVDPVDADGGYEVTEPEVTAPSDTDRCCPVGVCPLGEVCLDGACHSNPGSDGCLLDAACAPGQICHGAETCGCDVLDCEPQAGICRWPEGCCNSNGDCDAPDVCHEGVCRPPSGESGSCWNTAQCKVGEVCEGGDACACGATECEATPGRCSLPGTCCLGDLECGDVGRCVASRCVPIPEEGTCYQADDCSGNTVCVGAYQCPCGDTTCAIPTTPGICTTADVCCQDAGDCPEYAVCVEGKACLPAPGGNKCYVDGHCGPGRICEGAAVCSCGELCPSGTSTPGTCRTLTESCKDDGDCLAGMGCVIPDSAWCPGKADPQQGVCVEMVDQGCWKQDDCGPFERCGSERICTAPAGCSEPNQPGTCLPLDDIDDCCDSHRECAPGFQCRNSNTSTTCPPNGTAVCLPEPEFGESCWNYPDCPTGLVCYDAYVCACNARCGWSHEGYCDSPIGQACKTNIDCGTGYDCARDEECILNPCYSTTNCPISGLCKPKVPGGCWSHTACGDGEYCKGLRVCPTTTECEDPDVPGQCAPLEEAGGCCASYKACGPGLRCISAATNSGCVLDVTSVCVPITTYNVTCFTEEDCAPSRDCVDATLCPCGLSGCEDPPQTGTCELN